MRSGAGAGIVWRLVAVSGDLGAAGSVYDSKSVQTLSDRAPYGTLGSPGMWGRSSLYSECE